MLERGGLFYIRFVRVCFLFFSNLLLFIIMFQIGVLRSSIFKLSTVFLLILTTIRALFQNYLFKIGFISVSADEFSRGERALNWARAPQFIPPSLDPWLPTETYINGIAIRLIGDAILAPRITAFAFSVLLTCLFYREVFLVTKSLKVTITATLLVCFQTWMCWLSGTPMLEIYYLPFLVTGTIRLASWVNSQKREDFLFACGMLGLSGAFHIHPWLYVNTLFIFCIGSIWLSKRRLNASFSLLLIGFCLTNSYLLFHGLWLAFHHQSIFECLGIHSEYSKWFYRGYNVPWYSKIWLYPSFVLNSLGWILGLATLAGVFFSKKRLGLYLSLAVLLGLSVFNMFSAPATAAPHRYCIYFFLMLMPTAAQGICQSARRIGRWIERVTAKRTAGIWARYCTILFIPFIFFGLSLNRTLTPPVPYQHENVQAGRSLAKILQQTSKYQSRCLIETVYWTFLEVTLASGAPERIVTDRTPDRVKRDLPSALSLSREEFLNFLKSNKIRCAALASPALIGIASQIEQFKGVERFGQWQIYSVTH